MPKRKKSSAEHSFQYKAENYGLLKPNIWAPAGAAVLALAVFIAYFPSLNGGFIWDDETLLTRNLLVKAPGGLQRIWCTTDPVDFWPLTNTTFWLEWRLWGINPIGCHVTNLALHISASVLIWTILRRLSVPGAYFAALIFALHPVNVESVAWIAQRKNTLSILFFLLSILWYLKAEMSAPSVGIANVPSHGRPWERETAHFPPPTAHLFHWYWLSFAAFTCAMLGKGSAVVLPALVLLIICWRRRLTKWDLLRTVPYFIVAAVLTMVNIWFQRSDVGEIIRDAGFLERLLGAGAVVWFYLYKALLPLNLIFIYPQWNIQTDHSVWWLPLLAAIIVTAVLWLYRKTWSRPLLFAWGFFCVALLPVLGLTDVYFMKYSLVADHYEYTAIIGVIALLAAGWNSWQKQTKAANRWAAICVLVIATVALGSLTWQQSKLYSSPMTLYQATLEKNPECWMAHNNLGIILEELGNSQEANYHYNQSVLLNPKNAEAYNNLGFILLKSDQWSEAIAQFEQALRCKQNFAEAHNNLGKALVNIGRLPEAIEHYEQALRLKPSYAEAQNNLGEAMARIGRPEEAIKYYERALALKPDLPETQYNLGVILLQMGRTQEAINYFEQSLRLKPDFKTHNNLGTALLRTGRLAEAIGHYEQALRINSDYLEAYANLAPALAQAHRLAEAVAIAQKGLELARSKGQTALAKQFEDMLNTFRAVKPVLPRFESSGKSSGPTP
jgi:protein O-mannosyl-transferase